MISAPAFVASSALHTNAAQVRPASWSQHAGQRRTPKAANRQQNGAGAVFGTWALAGGLAAFVRKTRSPLRAESKEAAEGKTVEAKAAEEEKKPFNVWDTSTYGNITMDDVKKYGAAGTLSYVITELLFWAIAFPTEAFAFFQTQGHWPDFSKAEDSAAVFGLVFAASNVARLLLPIRFGAALAMAPWVDENIMQPLNGGKKEAATQEAAGR